MNLHALLTTVNFEYLLLFAIILLLFSFPLILLVWKKIVSRRYKNSYVALYQSFLEIIKSTNDGFILFSNTGQFLQANKSGESFLYETLGNAEYTFPNLKTVIDQLDELVEADLQTLISPGSIFEDQNLEIRLKNGSVKNFLFRLNPIFADKKLSFNYILTRDITEVVDTFNIANTQGQMITEIMAYSRDGYISLDKELNIRSMNQAAEKILFVRESTIVGKAVKVVFPEVDNSDFMTRCEYSLLQQEPLEFDYFSPTYSSWFNIKVQPNENGLTLFFFNNTRSKLNIFYTEAERKAMEDISKGKISFYQIIAKSIDTFQEFYPDMFCSVYTLNDAQDELKFFSSGYSTFLPTVPKPIKSDFLGFDFLLKNSLKLESENLYFEYLCEIFSFHDFKSISTSPITIDGKNVGVLFFYFKTENITNPTIEILQEKVTFFIENLFNHRTIFRDHEKLSIISEKSQKAFAAINIEGQITWSNASFNDLFERSKEELELKHFTEIINAQNTQMDHFIKIMESIHNFEHLDLTFPYSKANGEIKQIKLSTRTISPGDEIKLLIELDDITRQVNYERLLVKGQEFLRKITDTVPIVLFQCKIDTEGNFTFPFLSKEVERLDIGLSIDTIVNNPELIFRLVYKEDIPKIVSAISMAQKEKVSWNVEFRMLTKNKTLKWIYGVGVHERSSDGSFIWNGYLEDITDKKEKIKEIQEINTRFTYASKAVNEVIWELNLSDHTMNWSDGLSTIFGYNAEFYPSYNNLIDFIHPDDFSLYSETLQNHQSNINREIFDIEYRFKKSDGVYADVIDRGFILRDEHGEPQRIIGSIKDVSESKLFEKKKKDLINETQEFERSQFSMELHDGLAQQLVALNLYLSHLEADIPDESKSKVEICKRIVLDSLNQTRTLCYNLSPPELSNGLIAGLKSLFDRLNVLNGIQFKFTYDPSITIDQFENVDIYNVYRMIQEFLNNSLKHAECTEILCTISVSKATKLMKISIQDNGKGYDTTEIKYGFGIQNIHKRANLANARIKMASKVGQGSSLLINV